MAKIERCFGYKCVWLGIKGADIDTVLSCCPELKYVGEAGWNDAVVEIKKNWNSKVMLSGPYDGWVLLAGIALWDLSQVDQIVNVMKRIGAHAQEVCYFASHRVADAHAFARMVQGKITRLYSYADGQIFGCIGERSDVEKKLSLNYAEREEDLFQDGYDFFDEEDVLRIAEEWSVTPEALLGREEARTVLAESSISVSVK